MTIHDGTPFIASLTRLPGGTVGLLTVTHTGSAAAAGSADAATATATTRRRRAIFNVIFDNSGSMGGYTKLGLLTLVRPMLEKAWFDTTVVTLFEEGATSFDVPTPAAFDDMMKRLPVQQRTNITLGVAEGVKAATAALLKIPCEDDVHILTMLLTDGGHNVGAPITTAIAEGVAKGLAAAEAGRVAGRRRHEQQQQEGGAGGVLHTVLAFCLTNDSDASASMIVKEVLETAKVPTLPSVFYAASHSEMAAALTGVVDACAALFDDSARGGQFATLEMQHMSSGSGSGAEFIASGRDRTTHYFMPGQAETFVITLPSPSSSSALSLTVGGAPVTVAQLGDVGPDGVSRALVAVKDALQPLTRQAVAFDLAVIDKRLRSLEGLVAAIDAVVVREKAAAGSAAACRTPVQRRELLKRFVTAQHGLHEIKNAVAALRVKGRSNSDSISLLTGNQRKFAAVASKRSGTESRTAAEVMTNTTEIGAALRELVQQDLTAASTATTMAPSMTSVITLQTNAEFLAQWNDESTMVIGTDVVPVTASNSNDDAIMDVLSAFGIVAYPVELVTSDATQVDLMQLGVKRICPQQADTASMMLSWRLNSPIKFADGHTYTELLLLVDPALPRATTHVLQHSMLVQHLLSAMISKDLYMYLPPMHATMHVHSFAATVTKAIPPRGAPPLDCFVRMALHIVYSARRLFEAKVIFEEWANFERWLTELGSLTRSPSDQVYHVNSLSLKLAISSVDMAAVDDRTALLNQMNEALARRLVFAMSHFAAPVAFAQSLFGIDEADAPPVSENDLDTEPPRAAVEAECRKHIDPANVDGVADSRAMQLLSGGGGGGLTSVRALVEREWLPLFQMHQFTLAMHDTMAEHHRQQQSTSAVGGAAMDNFTRIIEAHQQIPDWLVVGVQRRLTEWGTDAAAMWPFLLGVADGDFEADGRQEAKQIHAVCAAAVMQAALYPDTHARVNVVNTLDITDPVEQRRMIGELYMAHYDVACSLKLGRRRAVIGEVTALTAASADVDTFSALIGVHTHGHSKRAFWGMLRGLLSDANEARRQQKLDVFREKSSKPGFDNVVARGRPRRG